jgi:type VI secretion system secreted protein VgrG
MDGQENIEVNAPKNFTVNASDIIMNALKTVSISAGTNITETAGMDYSISAGAMITQKAEADYMIMAKNIVFCHYLGHINFFGIKQKNFPF